MRYFLAAFICLSSLADRGPEATVAVTFTGLVTTAPVTNFVARVEPPAKHFAAIWLESPEGAKFVTNVVFQAPILSNPESSQAFVAAVVAAMRSTNLVREAIRDGRVCAELGGHLWDFGCGFSGCAVLHAGPTRYCRVCGKMQTQTPGEWR